MRNMMKLWAVVLLFGTVLFGAELHWEEDTATAFAKAKAENKNVMLMVEASRCRWCEKMKEETLSNEEVQKRLQNYILVKVLRSDKEEMKVLPESYYPAPSTFFMTPDGEIIERAIGFFEAEDFITYINDVEAN
ncbi:MAG: thioredoxin family protein [Campylobacterales bacterium]|nr:thioredoxin family protein [Campylobacterales bacterium]